MSVKVELDALADEVAQRPFGYLLTAGDDGPPHSGAASNIVTSAPARFR